MKKYKKFFIFVFLVSLTLFFLSCTDPKLVAQARENKIKMEQLDKKCMKIQEDIKNLDIEVSNLKNRIDKMSSNISVRIEDINAARNKLAAELRELKDIKQKLVNLESENKSLKKEIKFLKKLLSKKEYNEKKKEKFYNKKKGGYIYHLVKRGETLGAIAKKYGVTMFSIKKANNLKTTRIRAGQKLKIPIK